MEVRRLNPEEGFIREFNEYRNRVKSLETKPAGNITIRESLITSDPESGVSTIIGQLPDGSYGFEQFIGDIEPPPVATAPTVKAQPGVFVVWWDGNLTGPKPRDFVHVNVIGYKIVAGVPQAAKTVGVIRTASESVFVSTDVAAVGETWKFTLQSEDYNGNVAAEGTASDNVVMQSAVSDAGVNDALQAIQTDIISASNKAASAQTAANTAQSAADSAAQTALSAVSAASSASSAAAAKGKVIIQSAAPNAADRLPQNLWIDTTNGANTPKRWNTSTSTWDVVTDKVATDAAGAAATAQTKADQAFNSAVSASSAAGSAQSTADSKNRSWNQTSPPAGTGHKEGDLWFDTDDGNKLYLWKTSTNTWTPFQDGAIAALQTSVSAVTQTANGKNTIYYQGTQPSGGTYAKGDLWFDTANNYKLYTYTGSAWQATQDAAGALSVAQGKNQSFIGPASPTANATGDIWIDTANGNQMKRWNGSAWVDARDTTIATAQAAATGAQATANGKNTVYYQGTAPSGGTYRTGDVWFDTSNSYRMSTWTGSAWQTTQDSAAALSTAQSKTQTFIQGTTPSAITVGDLWINTSNNNQMLRASSVGTGGWVDARDTTIAAAAQSASAAMTAANGKNTNYYTATQPTGGTYKQGDLWFDTANNYKLYTYTGSIWQLAQDAAGALSTAQGKNQTFISATAPTANAVGDIWIDTANGNQLKRWSGAAWIDARDTSIASAAASATAAQATANSKNTSYYSATQPTGGVYKQGDLWFDTANNYRLSTYTGSAWQQTQDAAGALSVANGKNKTSIGTSAPSSPVTGDLWIDSANGNQLKRWSGTVWADARDTTIAAAQGTANSALTAANGKNKVYYQISQPSGGTYIAGDTWFDTDDGNQVYVYNGTAWTATDFGSSAIADLAITNAKIADATIQAAKIGSVDAGTITVGFLSGNRIAADTITGAHIAAGSITAAKGQIADAAITNAKIADATIQAAKIASVDAGTITVGFLSGSRIAADTITGTHIAAGAITAAKGQIADLTITTAKIADTAITNAKIADATIQAAKIGSVDAGTITVGTLDANRIGAATIAADKLVVGVGQNLAYNGSAETGSSIGYTGFIRATSTPPTGYNAYWTTTAGQSTTIFLNQPAVKVKPNTQYRVSVWVKANKAGSKTYLEPQTGSVATGERTNPIYAFSNLDVPTVWTRWTSVFTTGTAPLNTLSFRWFVNHTNGTATDSVFSFTGFELYEMNTGELIVDGAIQAGSAIIANGAIGTAQIGDAQITSAKILDANITTAKIADLAVTDAKISSITAGKIVASWLTAGVINAGAITTSMLAVTDITNFAPSYAESPNDWVLDSGMTSVVTGIAASVDKRRFTAIDSSGTAKLARGPLNAVQPGDELYGEGTIYRVGPTTNNISLRYYFYDNTKTFVSSASTNLTGGATLTNSANGTFQQIKAVVPSGVMYARLVLVVTNTTGDDIGMYNIRGYRRFGGQLIVDGAIQAGSAIIGTGAIGTAQIADLAVTNAKVIALDAGKMTTGLLDANRIDVGTISADKLVTGIGNNLVADPNFNNATLQARRKTISDATATAGTWTVDAANQLVTLAVGPTPGQLQWRLRETNTGNAGAPYPIDSGRKYNITFDVFRPTGSTPLIRSNIYYKKQDGTFAYVTDGMSNVTPPNQNAWNTVSRIWTPPADAVAFGVDLVVNTTSGMAGLQFRSPSVRAMSNATVIEDGAIITQHMTVGTIDGSIMSVNSISGNQLKFKTITADRLVISSTDNLVVEADFSNNGSSWGTLNANKVIISNAGRGSGPALRVTGSTALQTVTNLVNKVPVGAEDRFRGSFYVKSSAAAASGAYKLRMNQYTTASTSTAATIATSPALTAGQWTLVEGYSPALPAGTIAIEFFLEATNAATGTTTDFDYVAVTRAADGKLVVDGAIDGKTITGSIFRTGPAVTTSGGLQFDTLGLRAYDPLGAQTFNLSAITGNVTSAGIFSTTSAQTVEGSGTLTIGASFGNYTYNSHTDYTGIPGIKFTRVHSITGPRAPASILYDGNTINISTYDPDATGFVPNQAAAYVSVGSGAVSMGGGANGATYNPSAPVPTLMVGNSGITPGYEQINAKIDYAPSDGTYRSVGLYVDNLGSGYTYSGAGRFYTSLRSYSNQYQTTKLGQSRVEMGDGGIWAIFGERHTNGSLVSMIQSRGDGSGNPTGDLLISGSNAVYINRSFVAGAGGTGIAVTSSGTTITDTTTVNGTLTVTGQMTAQQTATFSNGLTSTAGTSALGASTTIDGVHMNWSNVFPTNITLSGVFVAYPGFMVPQYYRDSMMVKLTGVIGTNASPSITLAAATTYTVGTIPTAYRPSADILFSPLVGATMNTNMLFYVRANGNLQIYSPTAQTLSTSAFYVGLDGMQWLRTA